MPIKAEKYAFRLVRDEIETGRSLRASNNLRLYREWADAGAEEELQIFGQHIFQYGDTLHSLRVAIRGEMGPLPGQATIASFKP